MFTEMLQALTQQSTEFILENESLSLLQCWQLSLKLKLCAKLKTLILKNVQLDVAKLEVILVSLKNHKLTLIDFSENPLDDSDKLAKLLQEFLSQQSQLQHLALNKAQLGPKMGNVLIEFIAQSNSLQTINSRDNTFNLEIGKKTLILKNVQLDVAKLEAILVSLKNHMLMVIDFSENPLDDSDKLAKLLQEFLSQQSQLQHLALNKAQLGPKVGNVLIEFIIQTNSLQTINSCDNTFNLEIGKKTLILKNVQLNVAKLEVILVSLKNHKLTLIDFSENPLDDSDKLAKLLQEFLSQQSQLQHLALNKAQLGPKTGNVLIEFIVQTNSLQTINLCDNPFGLEMGKMLVAALCLNTTLIDLKNNNNAWNKGITQSIAHVLELKQEADKNFPKVTQERINYFLERLNEFFDADKLVIAIDSISVTKYIDKIISLPNNRIMLRTGNVEIWSLENKKCVNEFPGKEGMRIILLSNHQMVTLDIQGTEIWTMTQEGKWQIQQSFPTLRLWQAELLPNQQLLTCHTSNEIEIWENQNSQWKSIGKFMLTKYNFLLWIANDQFILVTDTQLAVCDFDSMSNQWKLSGTHTIDIGMSGWVLDGLHFLLCNQHTGLMTIWERNKMSGQWQAIRKSQYPYANIDGCGEFIQVIGKLTSDKILLYYLSMHDERRYTHFITTPSFTVRKITLWDLTNTSIIYNLSLLDNTRYFDEIPPLLQLSENLFLVDIHGKRVETDKTDFNEFALWQYQSDKDSNKYLTKFSVDSPYPVSKPRPAMYALENDQFALAYPNFGHLNSTLLIFDYSKVTLKLSLQERIEKLRPLKTIAPSSVASNTSTSTTQETKQEYPEHDKIKREEKAHTKEINITAISDLFSKPPVVSTQRFVSKDGFDLAGGSYAHLADKLTFEDKNVTWRLKLVAQNKSKTVQTAFVNAENTSFKGTGGISGAFHTYFNDGKDQLCDASKSVSPHLSPGDAILVHMKKEDVPYCIVQTTGPDWRGKEPKPKTSAEIKHDQSAQNDLDLLAQCYCNTLKEMELYNQNQIKQSQPTITEIIFPSISTNIFEVPFEVAVPAHLEGINQFFKLYPNSKIHIVMNISSLEQEAYEYLFEKPFNPNISFSPTKQ